MRNKLTYLDWTWTDFKIAHGTVGLEKSLPISALGIDVIQVEVKCDDANILNFNQNEPIRYFRRNVQLGIYYVQSIEQVSPDLYGISAVSSVGLLEQLKYYGYIFTGETVGDVIPKICGNLPIIVKSNLLDIKLYGWIGISTGRNALRQVLFAIGANLSVDSNGVLRVENLWDGLAAVIDQDRIYIDGISVKRDKPVTSVTVLEHQYIPGSEQKDLFEGTTTQGQRISFEEPYHDLQATGFEILESGANYAVVSAGSGKLTGASYIHATLEVTKPVTDAPIENEIRVEDATLVSLVNSNAVAERLAAYYACRETINVSAVIEREHPGQVVSIFHPWSKKMVSATLATSDVEMSATLRSSLSALVGFTPPQNNETQYYDERVILTGAGEWTPPEGVTEVTIVAIGKGKAGSPGFDGKEGQSTGLSVTSAEANAGGTWSTPPGDGGDGGEGGEGGKIKRATLQVTPGAPISYDALGEEAIFGEISSADGTAAPTGFVDPTTGEIFAQKGEHGISGAKGGKGGVASNSQAESGQDGGSVLDAPGGHGREGYAVDGRSPLNGSEIYWRYYNRTGGPAGGGAAFGMPGGDSPAISAAGDGADAPQSPDNEMIGGGGHGGHGGGGGGGAGGLYSRQTANTHASTAPNPGILTRASGGRKGKGSAGSEGGPAGVILYFRRPSSSATVPLLTSDKRLKFDKNGRLFIV